MRGLGFPSKRSTRAARLGEAEVSDGPPFVLSPRWEYDVVLNVARRWVTAFSTQ
ncbi:hypothetical protein [Streptomyces dangxiongensis]|uniref:hypothetical protein n=1 Tax=Streptomyces dangxiongensis TaxID=1442032 RepID=UPI00196A134B|nr:hypothetical protein [Streptomyces dangxiongensis]